MVLPGVRDSSLPGWARRCAAFLDSLFVPETGAFRSVPGGPTTLYGTCYGLLARRYLGIDGPPSTASRRFLLEGQDPATGLFERPELVGFEARPGVLHDREHLQWHLTCAALPVCQEFGLAPRHPIRAAHRFLEPEHLSAWLDRRNLRRAWFEGNNLLFVGQLLVYLRDVERLPGARRALDLWFAWLDRTADPATGLWGTNGFCGPAEAVYGGYHQLLVYYHEDHPLPNPRGLVDTVLDLQHGDGGFLPTGNGGACEDVDGVDILVNLYKRLDYRRPEIRVALRRCLRHILATQNRDGGFPYNRDQPQSHMGVPGTAAPANVSTLFPTWFRVHTLALIAQVLPDNASLQVPFRFSRHLSMGWHSDPPSGTTWRNSARWVDELPAAARGWLAARRHNLSTVYRRTRRLGGAVLRRWRLR